MTTYPRIEIVFYQECGPLLGITNEVGATHVMDVSELECFLIRNCLRESSDEYEVLLRAWHMLVDACAMYRAYMTHGTVRNDSIARFMPADPSCACGEILFTKNRYENIETTD